MDKNSGEMIPTIKTIAERAIARTIKPIVRGNFKILRFIIENIAASEIRNVDSSKSSINIVFTKYINFYFETEVSQYIFQSYQILNLQDY